MTDTELLPKLGSKVDCLRTDEKGKVVDVSGIVHGIFLDPRNRPMLNVKSGDDTFNVDLVTLNPSNEFKDRYRKLIEDVWYDEKTPCKGIYSKGNG